MSLDSKIEKLNHTNYPTWALVMTSLLKSKGLWKYISTDINIVEEAQMMSDEEAKTLMYAAMDPSQIIATGSSATARELWSKVRQNHQGAESDLRNNALAQFLGFKYIKGESILQYCGRYEIALGSLLNIKGSVDESTKIWVFRNSLPKELKSFVHTWSMSKPDGKIAELITNIKIQHHLDLTETEDQSNLALFSGERSRERQAPKTTQRTGDNRNHQQISSHSTKNNNGHNSNDRNNNNFGSISCSYCKTSGHLWKNCRKLKADNQRKKQFADRRNVASNRGASFMAHETQRHRFANFSEHAWIIDSGATSHMTPIRSYLNDYIKYEQPKEIMMGTGLIAEALGEGKVHYSSGEFSGRLNSVLYVPKLQENLLSLCKATSLGYSVEFTGGEVRFKEDESIKLVGFQAEKNLYVVELKPRQPFPDEDSQIALLTASLNDWHKRLGHIGQDAVIQLAKSHAVLGMDIDNYEKIQCEHCIYGKICRCPHPKRAKKFASEKAAVLHIDTSGKMPVQSLGGSQYFVLATEEFSGYRLIDFVRSKSEIPFKVMNLINRVQLETKRPVKMIVTDNGSEFVNQTLRNFIDNGGMLHTFSAPYTPEQNGLAERSNRVVKEGVRTLLSESKLPESLWAEAANTVVYTTNRTLSTKDKTRTRYELYYGEKPHLSNLRRFGQHAIAHLPSNKIKSTWARKGQRLVFIGYTERRNTYRLYNPKTRETIISCDVRFLDSDEASIAEADQHDSKDQISIDLNKRPLAVRSNDNQCQNMQQNSHSHDISTDCTMTTNETAAEQQDESTSSQQIDSSANQAGQGTSNQSQFETSAEMGSMDEDSNDSFQTTVDVMNDSNATEVYPLVESFSSQESPPMTRSRRKNLGLSLTKDKSIRKSFWTTPEKSDDNEESALTAFTLDDEPRTLKDAMESPDWDKWQAAMDEELSALAKNNTWVLVDRPSHLKPIKSKWVFKKKLDPNGALDRFKARLVAKGYSQIPNVDYKETFAPTASMNTIRVLFGVANQNKMEILQFDVKTAFLYGDLKETIFMEYPEGYSNPQGKVCKLIKSLYGLKQAPRQWNLKFDTFLKKFNLNRSRVDRCLYYNDDRTLFLVIYVDDGLVASTNQKLLENLVSYLKKNFDLKVMECEAFLGFKVKRDRRAGTLDLHQSHYIEKILTKFNMSDCKPASTPEEVGAVKFDNAELLTEEYPFKELVGSLLYLVTCTRPDIAHAVSIASRTSKPTTVHWQLLKRILRYLKGTTDIGIRFRWEKAPELLGYSDADYANDSETRKSTTGYCIFYGSTPVAWRCQLQKIVSLSTTEAEYISGCDLVKELMPLREMMLEMRQINDKPLRVLIDNQSTVKIARDEGGQQRTKHIDVREKWLTEKHTMNMIDVQHITGDKQAADILTKPLHKTKFINNRNLLVTAFALLTMLSVVMTDTFKGVPVSPLTFKPTKYNYFKGDAQYQLSVIMLNPCKTFFKDITDNPDTFKSLMDDCNNKFYDKIANGLVNCKSAPEGTNVSRSDMKELARIKRGAPFVIAGILFVAGWIGLVNKKINDNSENIKTLSNLMKENMDLHRHASDVIKDLRDNMADIQQWSADIDQQLAPYRHEYSGVVGKLAALINSYTHMFNDYEHIIKEINGELEKGRASPILRTLTNDSLWDEPASEWSHVTECAKNIQKNNYGSLLFYLNFNMPILDKNVKIMEAVPLDFYNQTEHDGHNSLCWMRYKGPRFVMANTTNNCVAELINWNIDTGHVRSQTCASKEDELKISGDNLWAVEECSKNPQLSKRKIQDKEVYGLHRIYCYPFNITIENSTFPCPDQPFELEGHTTYRIANLEHVGYYVEKTLIKNSDIHANREILNALNASKIHIKPINLTKLDKHMETYFGKLHLLPDKIVLKNSTSLFDGPMNWISDIVEQGKSYLETVGIIFGVVGAGILLIILAPVIEVLLLSFGLTKVLLRAWVGSTRRITSKLRLFSPVKRKESKPYWHEFQKLV